MRPPLPIAFAALLTSALTAQTEGALPDLGQPAAAPDGAPPGIEHIDREGLRGHAYWLSDDARNGRHTASAGQQATADYVQKHFESLGLKPLGDKRSFVQTYPLERVIISKTTGLRFGTHNLTEGLAVLHSSEKDKVSLKGRFQYCGNGARDRLPQKLKGRIPVIVWSSASGGSGVGGDLRAVQRYAMLARALGKTGARSAVVCLLDDKTSLANTLNYRGLLPDHGMMSFDKPSRPAVSTPLMVLNAENSKLLLAHIGVEPGDTEAKKPKATGKLTIQVKKIAKAKASNVVAVLEGTSKKHEAIVISAHHDHVGTRLDGDRFNGADDNASGTAGLLELAEAFAKCEQRPARSIVFLSVSGEELGLWGSAYYADHPTWPVKNIVANVNIDMIGRAAKSGDKWQMQVTPSHRHGKYSTLVKNGVALGDKFGVTFTSGDQYYARSDHYNFAKKGIPVVFFCDGEHPDYHQVTDHADKLDYVAMEAIARLAYWTTRAAADAPSRPKELGKQAGW